MNTTHKGVTIQMSKGDKHRQEYLKTKRTEKKVGKEVKDTRLIPPKQPGNAKGNGGRTK